MSKRSRAAMAPRARAAVAEVDDGMDSDVEETLRGEGRAVRFKAAAIGGGGGDSAPSYVNDVKGLQRVLAELDSDLPWIERLEVVSAEPLKVDADDDLKLELGLYVRAASLIARCCARFCCTSHHVPLPSHLQLWPRAGGCDSGAQRAGAAGCAAPPP